MREGAETEQRPAVQICDTGRTAAFWKKFKLDAEVMEGQRPPYRSTCVHFKLESLSSTSSFLIFAEFLTLNEASLHML